MGLGRRNKLRGLAFAGLLLGGTDIMLGLLVTASVILFAGIFGH